MASNPLQLLRRSAASRPSRTSVVPAALVIMVVMTGCASVAADLPFTAPAPYTETGAELDGTELRSDHLTGLEETGSFDSRFSIVFDGEDHAFGVNRSASVDVPANQSVGTIQYDSDAVEGDGLEVARYTNGSVTYRQVEIDAGQQTVTRYDAARAPYDDGLLAVQPTTTSWAAHADLVAAVADHINWTMVGVERYDDGWVTRYEATGRGNFSAVGTTAMAGGESPVTDRTRLPETFDLDVRSINATLLVSPDGVVRKFELQATGNSAGHPVGLTLTLSTDGIGSTVVEAPSWVDDARQRTA